MKLARSRLGGVWVGAKKHYGPKGKRVEWQSEYLDKLDLPKLLELREEVRKEYRKQFPEATGCTPLGFVPSHVADPVIRRSGLKVDALDHILLRIAITQDIRVQEGTWQSGPTGESRALKSPLPRSICGF